MPERTSHSRLSLFRSCPLRYRLRYIDKAPPEWTDTGETFLGSRVHESLEWLYESARGARDVPDADALVDDFHRRWQAAWNDKVHVVEGSAEDGAGLRVVGETCLRRYHERHAPFNADETLLLEARIHLELPDGRALVGFIDRVSRAPDGTLLIHDYKTSRRLPPPAEAAADPQLAIYQAGLPSLRHPRLDPGAQVRLVWHYLRHDETRTATWSPERLQTLLEDTAALAATIDGETAWAPRPGPFCAWCPFQSRCPEKKHEWELRHRGDRDAPLFDTAAARERESAEARDAAAAVDRAVLAIDELKAARERIRTYAADRGASAVQGAMGRARVRRATDTRLPARGEAGHERLRSAVIAAGLLETYADIDLERLRSDFDGGRLAPEVRDIVGRLLQPRTAVEVDIMPAAPEPPSVASPEPSTEPGGPPPTDTAASDGPGDRTGA